MSWAHCSLIRWETFKIKAHSSLRHTKRRIPDKCCRAARVRTLRFRHFCPRELSRSELHLPTWDFKAKSGRFESSSTDANGGDRGRFDRDSFHCGAWRFVLEDCVLRKLPAPAQNCALPRLALFKSIFTHSSFVGLRTQIDVNHKRAVEQIYECRRVVGIAVCGMPVPGDGLRTKWTNLCGFFPNSR